MRVQCLFCVSSEEYFIFYLESIYNSASELFYILSHFSTNRRLDGSHCGGVDNIIL
jgi:hypothetical protein